MLGKTQFARETFETFTRAMFETFSRTMFESFSRAMCARTTLPAKRSLQTVLCCLFHAPLRRCPLIYFSGRPCGLQASSINQIVFRAGQAREQTPVSECVSETECVSESASADRAVFAVFSQLIKNPEPASNPAPGSNPEPRKGSSMGFFDGVLSASESSVIFCGESAEIYAGREYNSSTPSKLGVHLLNVTLDFCVI